MWNKYGRVAVLMGGNSAEREISLKSGQAVLAALRRQDVEAVTLQLNEPAVFLDELQEIGPDRVFIALHGRGGEDGTMQGFFDTLGLPYTGSGVAGSAIAMNKDLSKRLWRTAGLPVPEAELLTPDSDFNRVAAKLGFPLMIKPAHEGSSVGMSLVREAHDLPTAFAAAYRYDKLVLAERYIVGGEYTASILGEQVLPLIRLQTPRAFYDYAAKYTASDTAYVCPCGLPAEQERSLQALALQAFQSLGASGWGRVDFMLDQAGQPWLLEVNTVPGMTDHSLVPMAAKAGGMGFDELVLRILETAWR